MRPIWKYLNAEMSRCNARINGFMKWNWENREDDDEEMPSTITMSTSKVDDKAGEGGGKGLLTVCPKPRPDQGAAGNPASDNYSSYARNIEYMPTPFTI
jgi:hypothetical protein